MQATVRGLKLALAVTLIAVLSFSQPLQAGAAPGKGSSGLGPGSNAPVLTIPISKRDSGISRAPARPNSIAPEPPKSLAQKLAHYEMKDGYRLVKDIEYAADRHLLGDLYLPKNWSSSERLPAVMLVHGGSWTSGNQQLPGEVDIAQRLAQQGYAAFSVTYRLIRDGGIYPKSIQDVRDAFGFLTENSEKFGIDKNKLGIFGASVGGMMALLAAYAPAKGALEPILYKHCLVKPKAVVVYAPLTDLRDTELTWIIKYMDDTPWHTPEIYAEASPITYAITACPTMAIHGTDDVTIAFNQSENLVQALRSAGVEAQLVPIRNVRHVPFHEQAGPVRELAFTKLLEFFNKQLQQ